MLQFGEADAVKNYDILVGVLTLLVTPAASQSNNDASITGDCAPVCWDTFASAESFVIKAPKGPDSVY